MEIKILGTGCVNCQKLEQLTREVIQELGIEATVDKVTELKEIARAEVLMTPGLMVNGEVKASGKVPSKAEITQIITSALAK
ncbi:MAG: thioredoxin family protein [Clostridia bacterium]|nr:MAG: thioredoxin family protein [Clostridia bacterium]